MSALYIRKIESALCRSLSNSEKELAIQFFTGGIHVNYAIEYFR